MNISIVCQRHVHFNGFPLYIGTLSHKAVFNSFRLVQISSEILYIIKSSHKSAEKKNVGQILINVKKVHIYILGSVEANCELVKLNLNHK